MSPGRWGRQPTLDEVMEEASFQRGHLSLELSDKEPVIQIPGDRVFQVGKTARGSGLEWSWPVRGAESC